MTSPPPTTQLRGTATTGSTLALPATAALAGICASSAIAGVITGLSWLSYVVVVVVIMAAAGAALRALRTPAAIVWVGQVFVLLCLAVTLFTNAGIFVVLPGPTALHELTIVLGQAFNDVQTQVSPVTADQPILCLVMLSMGLVAVAVDMLAVTGRVPAAAGLVLLCVYAVPASLDDKLLPWWSFALGAASFTILLAVDGVQRHQEWRGKLGLPAVATTGVAPATIALTATGLVVALFIGGTFTFIGTVGRLPGSSANGDVAGELGIKPFTVLSGMLDQKATTELFDVNGLPTNATYLQALTLDTYVQGQGWVVGRQMPTGVQADQGQLPLAPGEQSSDRVTKVNISAINWADVWLPVFGAPQRIQGVASDYRYDRNSGIVYSTSTRKPGDYVEDADLTVPTAAQLNDAGIDYSGVSPTYRQITGINQQVVNLAEQITSNASTEFQMAQDIYTYFRSPANGFTYSTQTKPSVTGDPLVDFLFHGKTGYCQQYATAMAVMLRVLNIPTRVGIGFTDGFLSGGHRVITSADAHAWVEVYFPGYGWVTFDPTPLADGRAQIPGFGALPQTNAPGSSLGKQNPDKPNGRGSSTPTVTQTNTAQPRQLRSGTADVRSGPPIWLLVMLGVLVLLALISSFLARPRGGGRARDQLPDATTGPPGGRHPPVHSGTTQAAGSTSTLLADRPGTALAPDEPQLGTRTRVARFARPVSFVAWALVALFAAAVVSWWLSALLVVLAIAATPAGVREWRRRRHQRLISRRGPRAADAAWDELLAESWDRGTEVVRGETIRGTANRMARVHGLDSAGRHGLQTLVGEVERSWYGAPGSVSPTPVIEESFGEVRGSLHRNAPLPWQARVLPRSVLRPIRERGGRTDDDEPTG